MFRRRRWTGGGAVNVDTQVLAAAVHPGDRFPGQVVLTAVDHDVRIETIVLQVVVRYPDLVDGDEQVDEIGWEYVDGPFIVRPGQEERAPFSMRLSWETPITELAGRALGPVVELQTLIDDEGVDQGLLHVSSLPLHEAVTDAFATAGFTFQSTRLVNERVPDADTHFDFHQPFRFADRGAAAGGRDDLEVTFLTNAVGCEVLVRPAEPEGRYWDERAPARRFIAAHHDVDRVDWLTEVRRWIDEVALRAS